VNVDTIREILASHESGISRGGLLAWARLGGDPQMTDAQLEAALAELGDQVVDVQGFLYLRQNAPASALRDDDSPGPAAPVPVPVPPPAWPTARSAPLPGAVPGWIPPDADAAPPGWAVDTGSGTPPTPPGAEGWIAPDGGWPAAPPSSSKRTMVVAAVGVAVFLVAAGIGALLLRDADSGGGTDATPALPTPAGGDVIGATTLALGDCLILPSEDTFDEVRRLACTEPHDGEVFFVEAYPADAYPSDDEFRAYAEAQCLPAFADFTGSAYDGQEVLEVGWFTPTAGSWENGDRDVACYLTPGDGSRTSQSYRGANP
jgi:hypothetical protein